MRKTEMRVMDNADAVRAAWEDLQVWKRIYDSVRGHDACDAISFVFKHKKVEFEQALVALTSAMDEDSFLTFDSEEMMPVEIGNV